MPLNDHQIRNAKPTEAGKKAKLFDGGGLYLEVTPAGGKIFRLKYRIDGKEKTLTIGKYPAVSLSEARQPPKTPAACFQTAKTLARPSNRPNRNKRPSLQIHFPISRRNGISTNGRAGRPTMRRRYGAALKLIFCPTLAACRLTKSQSGRYRP